MRVTFDSVFHVQHNGVITPKCTVQIDGVTTTPGVFLDSGFELCGVNLSQLQGHDLEIEKQCGTVVITGHY